MPVKTDNEELMAYAHKVVDALDAKNVRVELDDRAEKLGYRMREGRGEGSISSGSWLQRG